MGKRKRKHVQIQKRSPEQQLAHVHAAALEALGSMRPSAVAMHFADGQRAGVLLGFLDGAAEAVLEDVAPHFVPSTLEAINQRAVYVVNYLVGCTGLPDDQQANLVARLLGTPAPAPAAEDGCPAHPDAPVDP